MHKLTDLAEQNIATALSGQKKQDARRRTSATDGRVGRADDGARNNRVTMRLGQAGLGSPSGNAAEEHPHE
jgi:hypothetical protein